MLHVYTHNAYTYSCVFNNMYNTYTNMLKYAYQDVSVCICTNTLYSRALSQPL